MWTTVLPILPQEDLRSFADRQALVNSLTPTTVARRDGGRWATPAWGLPTGLRRLASRYGTQLQLPTAQDWMREHTLAPYYLSTLPSHRHAAFEARLLDYRPGPRRPLLPITASEWFSPVAVLCPECDNLRVETAGFSVVMRQWLLPFATRCDVHGELLKRFPQWSPATRGAGKEPEVKPLRNLQGVELAVAESQTLLCRERLLEVVGQLLQSRGFVTASGRVRRKELCATLQAHASGRYEHPQLDSLLTREASVYRVLAPLWNPKTCLHPAVAHALVQALREAKEVDQQQLWSSTRDVKRDALVAALESCSTLTQAAQQAGVCVTTAAVQAKAMGLPFSERPKKLNEQRRARIEKLLEAGLAIDAVARRAGVSSVSVYRVLNANAELKFRNQHAKRAREIQAARGTWQALVEENPAASRKELRAAAPATYAFLYRWDRVWVAEHPPRKAAAHVPRGTHAARAPPGAGEELKARLQQATAQDLMGLPPRLTATRLLKAAGRGQQWRSEADAGHSGSACERHRVAPGIRAPQAKRGDCTPAQRASTHHTSSRGTRMRSASRNHQTLGSAH
jgi:hypothetical protein